ncbi:pyrroline-5-carboxylate reductase [Marinomonas sp. 15G1-11]|uniref:Pyrroline-5-carboxylate reductase n=1 Tax=Marinomonas phaeophyticola TaxID=3004091 RepID=A0ABT4JW67_9GAMM|nr:pyrroline-5-carboxylate reductase [Marinomonas sp. 15G1-11]MCZ2722620.1 pyrroline-5-carboxylate reductase [Marinomonas sp. 15G1-11]
MQKTLGSAVKIAFIGMGNMASAIMQGLLNSGVSADNITGTARTDSKRAYFSDTFGINMIADNKVAVATANIVVLCVKPIQMQAVIEDFSSVIQPNQLFISVAAGLEVASLQAWLGDVGIVRSMPNTPAQLGAGVAGLIGNDLITKQHKEWTDILFSSVGRSLWVNDERHMHTVTALAGSSPAYFFRFIESMVRYGVEDGLTEEESRFLAAHSMLGAARMATELTNISVEQLRINITSPKGSTEQALLSFEANGIEKMMSDALSACAKRSQEFADQLSAKDHD